MWSRSCARMATSGTRLGFTNIRSVVKPLAAYRSRSARDRKGVVDMRDIWPKLPQHQRKRPSGSAAPHDLGRHQCSAKRWPAGDVIASALEDLDLVSCGSKRGVLLIHDAVLAAR